MSSNTEYLDQYCERLGPELWAEPVNAVTNLAFIAAALWLWRRYLKQFPSGCDRCFSHYWLIFLVGLIGLGSGLFHTFATTWSEWADVIPILLFQLSFLWVYLRQISKTSWRYSLLWLTGFIGVNVLLVWSGSSLAELTNGSIMYLPAIVAVGWIGMDYQERVQQGGWQILAAASLFCFSLTFRTLDHNVCEFWSLGTHFVWHLLNAVVLALCTWAVIRQPHNGEENSPSSTPAPASRVNL